MSTIEEDTIKYYIPDWIRHHKEELEEFYLSYCEQYPEDTSSFKTFCAFWFYRWRAEQRELQRKRILEEQGLEIDGQIVSYAKRMGMIR